LKTRILKESLQLIRRPDRTLRRIS
jgi:hypothetical protein